MQEGKVVKKAGFPLKSSAGMKRMKKKKRNNTREFGFKLGGLWAPLGHVVQGFKTPSCGSRMRSTKERKMIIEISSFQKV